jgi:hypothetical protein
MHFLEISGHRARKRLCSAAVDWFLTYYFPRHTIDLQVNHRGLAREGVYGWCDITDDDRRPRAFLIELHNHLDVEDYLKTLFHELVHLRQWVSGTMKISRRKGRLWKGQVVSEDTEYEDEPWEIEARKEEDDLLCQFWKWHTGAPWRTEKVLYSSNTRRLL